MTRRAFFSTIAAAAGLGVAGAAAIPLEDAAGPWTIIFPEERIFPELKPWVLTWLDLEPVSNAYARACCAESISDEDARRNRYS